VPLVCAVTLGGFFVFGTFHLWWPALASLVAALFLVCYWLWTSTALHPEKPRKDVGGALTLPLYVSGSDSVGWWGMFITMLADITAFICLVFGYFFFWTIHDDFPPAASPSPGVFWPLVGAGFLGVAWVSTLAARRFNSADRAGAFYLALGGGAACAIAGAIALVFGPWSSGLDPTVHAYGATVWILVIWTVLHVAIGSIMLAYCMLGRVAGRITRTYDMDLHNVVLYWHFAILTTAITTAVIAGFPLVA
jgi:cytochrome c oxidase subunit I+III